MITFNHGDEFSKLELHPDFLQQTYSEFTGASEEEREKGWLRRIPRTAIAELFSELKPHALPCHYAAGAIFKAVFPAVFNAGGTLDIGCQKFSKKETAQLRRWALSRRRKKS